MLLNFKEVKPKQLLNSIIFKSKTKLPKICKNIYKLFIFSIKILNFISLFGENDITFSFNVKFVSLRNTVDLQYIVNGYNGRNEYKNDEFSILQEGKALKININHETC